MVTQQHDHSPNLVLQVRQLSRIQAMEIRYLRKVGVVEMDSEQTDGIKKKLRVEAVLNMAERKNSGRLKKVGMSK